MVIKISFASVVKKIVMLILLMLFRAVSAQNTADSLEHWMAGFGNYANLQSSATQRWITANRIYPENSDTVLVFDTERPGVPVLNLVKMNRKQAFLGDEALVVQGSDTAEYIGLPHLNRISYAKVKKMDVLTSLKQYLVLDETGMLCLYNSSARLIVSVTGVTDYITDGKDILLAVLYENGARKIVQLKGPRVRELYTTSHSLSAVPGFRLGRYVAVTEKEMHSGKIRSVLIDLQTGRVQLPLHSLFSDADFIRITQIQGSDTFLIDYEKRVKRREDPLVDLWYTNDAHLSARKKGRDFNKYWLWKADSGPAVKLSDAVFDAWVPVSERFLLAFSRAETFDYRYSFPLYPMYLVDRYKGTEVKISQGSREAVISGSGWYIAMRDGTSLHWELIDVFTGQKSELQGEQLRLPFFTSDGRLLVFESDSGLWVYDLARRRFMPPVLEGYQTKIDNRNAGKIYEKDGTSFTAGTEDITRGAFIRTSRNGRSGYFQWLGGKTGAVIPETEYSRQQLSFTPESGRVITVEEFYNHRAQLYVYNRHRSTRTALNSGAAKRTEPGIMRKILTFRNSLGTEMKGILYYPQDFNPARKYPMVVRIYQEQGGSANKYPYPQYSGDGFNIRLLIEKGYFVYLPDTVVDARGPGIAALDCVHSAMEALQDHPNIDLDRVGLTGHSFGGYETNFIAGHSKRFRTYVSGAGMSDLTGRYFEYNAGYGINEYARIENGQFAMKVPFAEAKEKYFANNPVFFTDAVVAPVLLWAGMKDGNVRYEQTLAFYTALVRNRKDAVALFYPQGDHVLGTGSREEKDLSIRTLQWWDYFLKDRTKIPWIEKQMKNDRPSADGSQPSHVGN